LETVAFAPSEGTLEMLATILPGVREVRAPLAAGYAWLIVGWVLFHDSFPSKGEARGPLKDLYALEGVGRDVGVAVIVSVIAYLLGSVVIETQVRLGRVLARGLQRRMGPMWEDLATVLAGSMHERAGLDRPYAAGFRRGLSGTAAGAGVLLSTLREMKVKPERTAFGLALAYISENRAILKTRLLDVSPELHTEVDRPDAEATFRMALWPPLAALILCFMTSVNVFYAAGLVVPAALAWQWLTLRRASNDALVTAIAVRPELRATLLDGLRSQPLDDDLQAVALDETVRTTLAEPDTKE
jgi:hypothetical protein